MPIRMGDFAFLTLKETKMELIELSYMKKWFKKLLTIRKKKKKKRGSKKNISLSFLLKNKKKKKKLFKIWINLIPNYIISKKSKNSRMGKGKGSFKRWVIRIRRRHILFEFMGVPEFRLKACLIKFNKKFNTKLCLNTTVLLNYNYGAWSNFRLSLKYFDKYRFM